MATESQLSFFESPAPLALLTPAEIFERADAHLLQQLGEDRRIERKPSRFRNEKLAEYLSMWANTPPHGGLMVLGQRDGGAFEGMTSAGPNNTNRLEKAGYDHCPAANYRTKRVPVRNDGGADDFVVVMLVDYHRTRVVRTVKGEVFRRVGDEKRRLTAPEIRELQVDKKEVSVEQEPVPLSWPEDFDYRAVNDFVSRVSDDKGWTGHTTEEVLELMNLGSIDGTGFIPNTAFALLFSRRPRNIVPGCRVRFLRFDSETEGAGERWNAVRDEFIDGTIPEIISRTDEAIQSQVRTFSKAGPRGKFFTEQEYP